MNVLYDLSVLGVGYYVKRARTGIARVIENLALELHESTEVNMRYCAYNTFLQYLQTRKYLGQEFVPFGEHFSKGSGLRRALLQFITHHYHEPEGAEKALSVMQRVISSRFHALDSLNPSLDSRFLDKADIFHATFYPFPEKVRTSNKLKKFITVYDLIPILFPKYFEFDESHLINDVVACIGPEDRVLAISESTKNDLCNYKDIDPSRVFVTPLAASEVFWPCHDAAIIRGIREKYGIPDEPYILSLCTLEPRKNIAQTIRCFARMLEEQKIRDLNLVLVGSKGWDFDHIFEEMSNASIKMRIIVTGYLPDEDLAPLYSGAMMFVYPSFYEGFGLPPLEAMQCGVPVVTSNTSSLPEVVGDAGIMVAPEDSDALSQAMYDIYSQPSLKEDMSVKSLARAKQFSWGICAQKTKAAYRSALND